MKSWRPLQHHIPVLAIGIIYYVFISPGDSTKVLATKRDFPVAVYSDNFYGGYGYTKLWYTCEIINRA